MHEFHRGSGAETLLQLLDVFLDRCSRQLQIGRDLVGMVAAGKRPKNLKFPIGETCNRCWLLTRIVVRKPPLPLRDGRQGGAQYREARALGDEPLRAGCLGAHPELLWVVSAHRDHFDRRMLILDLT